MLELQQSLLPYRPKESSSIERIEQTGIATAMNPNCKIAVGIPVFYEETNVDCLLAQFIHQNPLPSGGSYEMNLLFNGPPNINLMDSPAYKSLSRADRIPKAPLNKYFVHYERDDVSIGRIRRDLSFLALRRALSAGLPLERFILLNHDADLQGLPDDYLSVIDQQFGNLPNLNGITGPYLYNERDLLSNHLFFATQRFSDFLEIIRRYRERHIIMRGGNSAFRANAYVRARGHQMNKKSEHAPLYRFFVEEDSHSVRFDSKVAIVTSPRRQLAALKSGIRISARHNRFGEESDLKYSDQKDSSQRVTRVTDRSFVKLLCAELQSIFYHDLRGQFKRMPDAVESWHAFPQNVDRDRQIYLVLKHRQPECLAQLQSEMRLSAAFLGIKLTFNENKVIVGGIDRLRKAIAAKDAE